MITIEKLRKFVQDEKYEFYAHAITEGYPERDRVLVGGELINRIPLHVVCNYSDPDIMYIVTTYIPSDDEWTCNYQKRKKGGKK